LANPDALAGIGMTNSIFQHKYKLFVMTNGTVIALTPLFAVSGVDIAD
jgi:hypothetical protein